MARATTHCFYNVGSSLYVHFAPEEGPVVADHSIIRILPYDGFILFPCHYISDAHSKVLYEKPEGLLCIDLNASRALTYVHDTIAAMS